MRIQVFGRVMVHQGDVPGTSLATRPRTVLAVLAARHGRLVTDDELIHAIWPTDPPKTTKTAIQGYILTVRDALEPGRPRGDEGRYVLRDAAGYRLVVDADELDLAEFESAAQAGRQRSESQLQRLIELSDQPVFREFPDADWARAGRAAVGEIRVEALVERFQIELSIGDGAAVLPALRVAHEEFPFDERLAHSLMLALYRNGRQQESLEIYAVLRRRLRDELGISPGVELDQLQRDVLNHAPGLLPHPRPGPNAASPARSSHPSGLVGRQDDIDAITDALLAHRSVTVVGPGGVGKSSVATEVVAATRDKFEVQVWLDLATVAQGGVRDAAAAAFGITRPDTTELGTIISEVFGSPVLVVLDTCEVAADSLPRTVDSLLEAPNVHVLLTSRTPVGYRSERQYRLDPLQVDDAVEVLRRSSIRGSGEDLSAVRELARRLDGLPLALELVSRQLTALGPKPILDGIESWIVTPNSDESSSGPERHRSVQALVEWSLDLVGDAETAVLTRIAAMSGDVSLAALVELPPLESVPVERLPVVVGALVDASLVLRVDDAPTFRLLDTVAAVVVARHADAVAAERDVLATHVTTAAWSDYTGQGASTVDTWIPGQFESCLEHLAETPDVRGVMLATAAARMWLDRGVMVHGRRLLERALLDTPNIPDPLASIGWMILGFNQTYLGDGRGAIVSYRRALETAHTVPFPGGTELVESTLAWLECDFERSWQLASSAVDVMTVKTRRAPANLVGFAKSAVYAGDLEGAADCYERARRLAAELDDPIAEANALRLAAVVQALQGNHDAAWKWAHQSLVLHDPVRSPLGAAQASSSMALIALLSGDEPSAENWSRIAVERVRRQFDVQTVAVTVPVIAVLSIRAGRLEHATRLYGWLDGFVESVGHVHHPTTAELQVEVRQALESSDAGALRSWSAHGAAMALNEMLRLAVS